MLDSLARMKNLFPSRKEEVVINACGGGLVWELLRIKTVFYASLLYKLEQDPALSTALSLRRTQVVFLWQHLLSTLVKKKKNTGMPFDLQAKALFDSSEENFLPSD